MVQQSTKILKISQKKKKKKNFFVATVLIFFFFTDEQIFDTEVEKDEF